MANNEPKCRYEDGCPGLSDEAVEFVEDGGGVYFEWLCDRCRVEYDQDSNLDGDDYPDRDEDDTEWFNRAA